MPMNPGEFADKMRAIFSNPDGEPEEDHEAADKLMVELLTSLGYGEGAKVFDETAKWYS